MSKHDFIPLVTYRGWSIEKQKWSFGQYFKSKDAKGDVVHAIVEDHGDSMSFVDIDKDSLGIYTGKDDKHGNPIFCGVSGAKYGSDIISDGDYGGVVIFKESAFGTNDFASFESCDTSMDKVIGNQYEQHLSEIE